MEMLLNFYLFCALLPLFCPSLENLTNDLGSCIDNQLVLMRVNLSLKGFELLPVPIYFLDHDGSALVYL